MFELSTAYLKYADSLHMNPEVIYWSTSSMSIQVFGSGARAAFKDEAGKHTVQRVPPTEKNGRRHTSIVSVAILELLPRLSSELNMKEVELTTQRSSGPGGQNANKVESSVRAVHKPTGITVRIDDRDQHQNKALALEILANRVFERKQQEILDKQSKAKSEQLGGGTRSGKIRTYSFIDGYVLDHRTGKRTHDIKRIMKGCFDLLK